MINLKLKNLKQTCIACPSQWEGELENGKFIYIRYRWGNLGYGIGENHDDAVKKYNYGEDVGDNGFDGEMNTEDMMRYLGLSFLKEK